MAFGLYKIEKKWSGSVTDKETSLHQISPYIGKMKSSIAKTLVNTFTKRDHIVYDPFCGSGTIALEAWIANRRILANDLSPYAYTLTKAKLSPYISITNVSEQLIITESKVREVIKYIDLRYVPSWVRNFFHPETLRETLAWANVLKADGNYFFLSCLLGILHHQRPGFLSFPSSHAVPYLRPIKFPRQDYPELYEYRSVKERLEAKLKRALKRVPNLNYEVSRTCYKQDATSFSPPNKIDAVITSPPYMSQLHYGRDNRLRLWFLGYQDHRLLDKIAPNSQERFLMLMRKCLTIWTDVLNPKGMCVLVLGDVRHHSRRISLASNVVDLATKELGAYTLKWQHSEKVPEARRVRKMHNGTRIETIVVLQKRS